MISRTFRRAGKWWVDYRDARAGKRIRRPVAPTRAEAEDILAKIRSETVEHGYFEPKRESRVWFRDFVEEYLVWARNSKCSWERDAQILHRLSRTFEGKLLSEITPAMIEQYKAQRGKDMVANTGRIVGPRSVNYDLAILKALFNKAIKWEKAQANPVRAVSFCKLNNARMRFLDQKEIQALLEACTGQWRGHLKPIVAVALNTGMRKGEILGLRWSDIDYARGRIQVRTSKNGEGRSVPMNEAVREALRACVRVRQVVEGNDGAVFCDGQGKPRREIRNAFNSALKKAGIKDCHFHDLRHTFASHLVSNGVDIMVIRDLLGHKTLAMTLRYAHLSPDRGIRAVSRLSEIYGTRVAQEGGVGEPR